MEPPFSEDFKDFTKQREVLISGHFNTLFNNLSLNLPYRFFAYSNPDSLNPLFENLFNKLENIRKSFNKNDAWAFDDVMKLLSKSHNNLDAPKSLNFLVNNIKVPEKHIYIRKEPAEYQIFPTNKIYVSRYAMCLVTKNLLSESKSFKSDISRNLLTESQSIEKPEFESEMIAAFAGYYFSHPETDPEDLIELTWNWVRGKRLKLAYESAMNDLEYIVRGAYGREFSFHKLEEFKQKFIFDIIFKKVNVKTFKEQYEAALESYGYKLGTYDSEDNIKWHKRNKVAPKYPGAFFAPQITFLLTWAIRQFCEFEKQEFKEYKNTIPERVEWLQSFTKNFFSSIQEGLNVEKCKHAKSEFDFKNAPIFVNQHHSEANKIVNSIKNGSGPRKTDKQTGEKVRECQGALEFWKDKDLFDKDYILCLNFRKRAEEKLAILHSEYKNNPNYDLAKKIEDFEIEILNENLSLYITNFQSFINVKEIIGSDGKFKPRPMFGPQKIAPSYSLYIPKSATIEDVNKIEVDPLFGQLKIDFKNPNTYEIKPINLNLNRLPDFQILPESNIVIPRGIPFAANPATGKRYYSEVGEFESINPLLSNPPLLSKSGTPSPADANFGFCNFLFEMDHLSMDEQIRLSKHLVSLNVINRIVFSGNKSLHMRCTIRDIPNNKSEYRWLFLYLAEKYNLLTKIYDTNHQEYVYTSKILDFSCSNNGRATRRPEVIRNDTKKKQDLLHQTNTVLDVNWRTEYQDYVKKQKQREEELAAYRASFANHTGPNSKLIEKVKWLLLDWHDGNRHNLLNLGLIPMMWYAGWTEKEITNALYEEGNSNLNQTILKYISNVRQKTCA